MAMSNSKPPNIRDSVYIGVLSLWVAFMSSTFVIRVVHTSLTSAGWEDSLDSNDPVSNMVAMIAISSVVYSLLTRIKNRYGLLASFEGACWLIGSVPILFWIIDKGRVLPDISNYPYLGLFLVIAAVCLHVARSRLLKSSLRSSGDISQVGDDSEVAEGGGNEPPPHEATSGGQGGKTTARRWMLGLAAGAVIVVAALVPQSFPLLPSESVPDPAENCRGWYDTKVIPLYESRLSLWSEWSNALNTFVGQPGVKERILSEIDAGMAPSTLLDRPEANRKWAAAQDLREVEFAIAMLDDRFDDSEVRRIVMVRLSEMHALMDALTIDFLLADIAGFYPMPDAEGLETELRRAALGLESACDL